MWAAFRTTGRERAVRRHVAPAGTRTRADGPTSVMRPSRTITDCRDEGLAPVIEMTVTFRMATVPCPTETAGMQANEMTRITKRDMDDSAM